MPRNVVGPWQSTFSCCGGGLSLGLEEAGFEVILGVDLDEYAVETHRAHFGGVSLRADLSDSDEISKIIGALQGVTVFAGCGFAAVPAIFQSWQQQDTFFGSKGDSF